MKSGSETKTEVLTGLVERVSRRYDVGEIKELFAQICRSLGSF